MIMDVRVCARQEECEHEHTCVLAHGNVWTRSSHACVCVHTTRWSAKVRSAALRVHACRKHHLEALVGLHAAEVLQQEGQAIGRIGEHPCSLHGRLSDGESRFWGRSLAHHIHPVGHPVGSLVVQQRHPVWVIQQAHACTVCQPLGTVPLAAAAGRPVRASKCCSSSAEPGRQDEVAGRMDHASVAHGAPRSNAQQEKPQVG